MARILPPEKRGQRSAFRKMTNDYIETILPTFAKPTRDRYLDVINKNLLPAFGNLCLRDVTPLTVQQYFSGMGPLNLAWASMEKIRVVLSSIFKRAVEFSLGTMREDRKVRLAVTVLLNNSRTFPSPESNEALLWPTIRKGDRERALHRINPETG